MKADLKSQNEKKKVVMKELAKSETSMLNSEKMGLEEEAEILKGQEAALKMAIQKEKTRIAEAEKRAREEAARKAREEEERKARGASGETCSS